MNSIFQDVDSNYVPEKLENAKPLRPLNGNGYFDSKDEEKETNQSNSSNSLLPSFASKLNSENKQLTKEEEEDGEVSEIPRPRKIKPWEPQQSDAYAESFPSAREFSFSEAHQELVDDGKDRRFAGMDLATLQANVGTNAKSKQQNQQQHPKDYLVKKEKKHKNKSDSFYDTQLSKIEKVLEQKKEGDKTPSVSSTPIGSKTPAPNSNKRDISTLNPQLTPLTKKQRT
jgi:hypothetical protein